MPLPAPATYLIQTLWKRMVRLDTAVGPPYALHAYNSTTNEWQELGSRYAPVVLSPSDPPDFVEIGGDIVMIREL